MEQAFISVYGKVKIEKDVLFIRNVKPVLSLRQFAWVAFRVAILIRFFIYFFEDESPKRNIGLVLFGFLSLFYGIELARLAHKTVFQQSFANRIPLRHIRFYRLQDDANGLETHLFLTLRSGRERKISFRTREKEYEALAERLSHYLADLKLA